MATVRNLGILLASAAVFGYAGADDDWRDMFGQAQKAAAAKDYQRAESLFNKAISIAERFGKDDTRVAQTLQGEAKVFRAEKKMAEAETALQRALTIFIQTENDGSENVGNAYFEFAELQHDLGKADPAVQAVSKALAVYTSIYGPNDVRIADALCIQGDGYLMLKKYASAEQPLKRCADIRVSDGGTSTREFGDAVNSLAIVYSKIGKSADSEKWFNMAETNRRTSYGFVSQQFVDTLEAHAAALHELSKEEDSRGHTDDSRKHEAAAKGKEKMAASIRKSLSRNK